MKTVSWSSPSELSTAQWSPPPALIGGTAAVVIATSSTDKCSGLPITGESVSSPRPAVLTPAGCRSQPPAGRAFPREVSRGTLFFGILKELSRCPSCFSRRRSPGFHGSRLELDLTTLIFTSTTTRERGAKPRVPAAGCWRPPSLGSSSITCCLLPGT